MPRIELKNICNHICKSTHLSIRNGELLVLAGTTGAGKTTLLNVIAGLAPYQGSVRFNGIAVDNLSPAKRNVGYLFQDFALFPHLSVWENIAFGLKARSLPAKEISRRVAKLLQLFRMEELGTRYPRALSGGEKQRCALARTLAPAPRMLLLDEPFSSLDPRTAKCLRLELKGLQQKLSLTTVYVTHNQMEAFEMGDRIAVVHQGNIEQIGKPADILFHPRTESVSTLFGAPNILQCRKIEPLDFGLAKATCGSLSLIIPWEGMAVDKVAIFPQGIHLAKAPIETPMPNKMSGEILAVDRRSPVVCLKIESRKQILRAELPEHLWDEMDLDASAPVHIAIALKWIRVLPAPSAESGSNPP